MASLFCSKVLPNEKQPNDQTIKFFNMGSSQKSFSNSSPKQVPINYIDKPKSNIKHEILLHIPGCVVSLMEEGDAIEIARGDFSLQLILDQNVSLATIIHVGKDLKWPLTIDEPVLKLDAFHYLFTLPLKDGDPLSYGVTFSRNCDKNLLSSLDALLKQHACFSCSSKHRGNNDLDWREFAPNVEGYNGILARAIAEGTGHIVKGIFMCSNAYTNQVQKGGELIVTSAVEEKKSKNGKMRSAPGQGYANPGNNAAKKESINHSIKRVRNLSSMTEKMSKTMLEGLGIATGSVMKPLVHSKQGRAFFSIMPGEVLLASLDAVDKILNAAEVAEKQALRATSGAASRVVSNKYGENAGEATEDALATVGHVAGTAWNILKMRRALTPSSASPSGVLRNTGKTIVKKY